MKKTIVIFIATLFTINISAQTTEAEKSLTTQSKDTLDGWKTGGIVSLNLTQVGLTNWQAGGENSLSVNGLLSLFANLKKGNSTWDNSLDLGYGILQQSDDEVRKTDDKIDFTSKYGQKAFKNWYYAGLINFKSQMTPGYDYPNDSTRNRLSDFLAPGYMLGAIGMDYKPNEVFNLFISPITTKMTIVNVQTLADAGAFGVDPAEYDDALTLVSSGKKIRVEYGGYLRALLKKDIMKNINLQSKLELFSNYEDAMHVDVNWEVLIAMKVNKYISATVSTQLLYDHDIDILDSDGKVGPRTQFKEVIGVGVSYKF